MVRDIFQLDNFSVCTLNKVTSPTIYYFRLFQLRYFTRNCKNTKHRGIILDLTEGFKNVMLVQ